MQEFKVDVSKTKWNLESRENLAQACWRADAGTEMFCDGEAHGGRGKQILLRSTKPPPPRAPTHTHYDWSGTFYIKTTCHHLKWNCMLSIRFVVAR